jgi:hypothetical protein
MCKPIENLKEKPLGKVKIKKLPSASTNPDNHL